MKFVDEDEKPPLVDNIFARCQQANKRGIFTGDLCNVQIICKDIADVIELKFENYQREKLQRQLDHLFEAWLSYEHWEAFKQNQLAKEMKENEQRDSAELSASSMGELLNKLRQNADVEVPVSRE